MIKYDRNPPYDIRLPRETYQPRTGRRCDALQPVFDKLVEATASYRGQFPYQQAAKTHNMHTTNDINTDRQMTRLVR
jgi:hypothetical protein